MDGKTEYTYATAGTENGVDWKNNATQLVGASEQYAQSKSIVGQLKERLGGSELTFTGHSLGGGLAEANSISTGDKAITFNAAGLSSFTKAGGKSNTDAYIMTTDPLNAVQLGSRAASAGGNKHFLQPRSLSGVYNGHSINSVIEALSTPTIGQQMFNKLKQALIPPKLY